MGPLPCYCGLLHRLAHHSCHGNISKHHQLDHCTQRVICTHSSPQIHFGQMEGPQFSSNQFRQFSTQWKFQQQTSSPHYPKSNGKAEAIIKSMKKIICTYCNGRYLDGDKLCRALLQYRTTPSVKDELSPAQKLFGHPIQDTLPAHTSSFTPTTQLQQDQARAKAEKVQQQATIITTEILSRYQTYGYSPSSSAKS